MIPRAPGSIANSNSDEPGHRIRAGEKARAGTFDPLAVHVVRTRPVAVGTRQVETTSHGEAYDPASHRTRSDHRTGTAHVTAYEERHEPMHKTPQLHEQEYRTRLATLRVGERLVRERGGVRRERVHALAELSDFVEVTRSGIALVRERPIYLPPDPLPDSPPPAAVPDAAARLGRARVVTWD